MLSMAAPTMEEIWGSLLTPGDPLAEAEDGTETTAAGKNGV